MNTIAKEQKKGILFVFISALGFGLMPTLGNFAYSGGITTQTLLFIRFTAASVILLVYSLVKKRDFRISRKSLPFVILLGIFYTGQSTFYFSAIKYLSPSLAALILYIYPAIICVISFFFFHVKITKRIIIALVLSFSGVVLITGKNFADINIVGVFYALGAAFVYAFYIITGNHTARKNDGIVITLYVTAITAVLQFVIGLTAGTLSFDFSPATWYPIGGITIFSTVIAIAALFAGVKRIGSIKTSIIGITEPLFAVIFVSVFFQQIPAPIQLAGGVLIIAGALFSYWTK